MTKEFKAFRDILEILSAVSGCEVDMNSVTIITIKSALQRLEAIDNAKPSEALKIVDNILNNFDDEKVQIETMTLSKCNILAIKQALLKAQEQEKVLEIIKKKRVNVNQLLLCWKVEMYNSRCRKGYELSKEEFDLLKRLVE